VGPMHSDLKMGDFPTCISWKRLGQDTYYVLELGKKEESQGSDQVAARAIFQVNKEGAMK
jgi:hypothetical protein